MHASKHACMDVRIYVCMYVHVCILYEYTHLIYIYACGYTHRCIDMLCSWYVHPYNLHIHDPGSAVPPPLPHPQWFPPPCGVVWSGGGSAWGGFPPPRLWHGVGSGFLAVVPPCVFGSALGVWYTHPYDDNDGDDDHHHHHH